MTWAATAIGVGSAVAPSILGGGESKNARTVNPYTPVAKGLKAEYFPRVGDFAQQYGDGQGLYQGSLLAPENWAVKHGTEDILGRTTQLANRLDQGARTVQGFLNTDMNSPENRAIRDAYQAEVQAGFDPIRMGIEDRFTMGQPGSIQQALAMGAATQPLSRALATGEANLINRNLDRGLEAARMAPSIFGQAATMPGQIVADIGGQRTERAQLEQAARIQEYEQARNNELRGINEIGDLYGRFISGGQSGYVPSQGANKLAQSLGIFSTGMDIYNDYFRPDSVPSGWGNDNFLNNAEHPGDPGYIDF
jgi:hypothetical protein